MDRHNRPHGQGDKMKELPDYIKTALDALILARPLDTLKALDDCHASSSSWDLSSLDFGAIRLGRNNGLKNTMSDYVSNNGMIGGER